MFREGADLASGARLVARFSELPTRTANLESEREFPIFDKEDSKLAQDLSGGGHLHIHPLVLLDVAHERGDVGGEGRARQLAMQRVERVDGVVERELVEVLEEVAR